MNTISTQIKIAIAAEGLACAPPPFSTYHATVTCNGTFAGIPIQYGNASQDVSG